MNKINDKNTTVPANNKALKKRKASIMRGSHYPVFIGGEYHLALSPLIEALKTHAMRKHQSFVAIGGMDGHIRLFESSDELHGWRLSWIAWLIIPTKKQRKMAIRSLAPSQGMEIPLRGHGEVITYGKEGK